MSIPAHYLSLYEPLDGVGRMLEFGNKRGTEGDGDTYKRYFESRGILHTSIDLNGHDDALAMDLRKPLGLGEFDCVTNIGTIEHVTKQEPAWRNLLDSCRMGGLVICITPAPGNWPGHGIWHPSQAFYKALAFANGFGVERLYHAGEPGRALTYARLRRESRHPWRFPRDGLVEAAKRR